ncbi:cyclin B1 interacting protein 1, E3 ubiquitin protein ligase [Modicella reniformis]|uniref:Cyclin B1 interacting protein 1, E3 ubiquitin protein ligase n=1 Tax=Modicella reniformis TaxID=1440133 RepID=A0A9P6LU31_9FUNG|nr:cyclin B1 interacting protein 1, E3 ubiquitin protein ligase [Modicella reniformis]
MEICTRAISFWTYQTSQEAKYQEMTQKALEDKLSLYGKQQHRMTREVNVELTSLRDTVSGIVHDHFLLDVPKDVDGLQKDIEQEKRKVADMSEQLEEKTRQLSKLRTMYERQKRRPLYTEVPQQTLQQHLRDVSLGSETDPYRPCGTIVCGFWSNTRYWDVY